MTYGVNAPAGLQAASYGGSSNWDGSVQVFPITAAYGTALYTGDLVTLTSGLIVQYAPGTTPVLGVFMGCRYVDPAGVYQFSKYWPAAQAVKAGTYAYADVITDVNTFFTIQTNSTVTWAQLTKNVSVSFATAGSSLTGLSGMVADTSGSLNTTATLPLHIIAFDNGGNPVTAPGGTSVNYVNIIVKLNNSLFAAGATGI